MLKHHTLQDLLFCVQYPGGDAAHVSLPEVLAALSAKVDLTFTQLRPHQRPAWHAFLVQLAYLALEADDDPTPPADAAGWAARLRALTASFDDGPWCLVNTDWQQPAFLQPPCSAGRMGDFKRSADAAQDIDILVTSRHHDEKGGKLPLGTGGLDTLVYALVSLQGWSSFLGAGNYSTMRMNGGFSSRPQFRLAYERGSGAEFHRDLTALLDTRDEMHRFVEDAGGIGSGGAPLHKLLWLLPWDEGSLPLADVHPFCLEVSRRVRLVDGADGKLRLLRASSNAMRVAAKEARGVVLDPWVPIVKGNDGSKALTAQARTLGYRSLQALLFDTSQTTLPTLARPTANERRSRVGQEATLIAQVLVSGDGGTDGLLVRELTMPPAVRARYATDDALLGQRSKQFVELAAAAAGKALRPALLQFVDGGKDVDWKNRDFAKAVEPWVARYESMIDEAFFGVLFTTVEQALADTPAQSHWAKWLAGAAHVQLTQAGDFLPTRDASRLFAKTRAERMLNASLRKQFRGLLDDPAPPPAPASAQETSNA